MKEILKITHGVSSRPEVTVIATMIGSVISGGATFYGLRSFISTGYSDPLVATMLSAGITVLIQLLLLFSVWRLIAASWITKPFWLVMYVLCAFFSVVFAIGFWTVSLDGKEIATRQLSRRVGPYVQNLQEYESAFKNGALVLDRLREHSQQMATLEREEGTSCGYKTEAKKGPRYALRVADAEVLDLNTPRIVALGDSLGGAVTRLTGLMDAFEPGNSERFLSELRQLAMFANHTRNDPAVLAVLRYLEGRVATKGVNISVEGWEAFNCPDHTFDSLSRQVIDVFEALPPLDDASDVTLTTSAAGGVRLVLDKVTAKIPVFLGSVRPRNKETMQRERTAQIQGGMVSEWAGHKSDDTDLPGTPILLGVMVDLLILLAAIAGARVQVGTAPIQDWSERLENLTPQSRHLKRMRDVILAGLSPGVDLYGLLEQSENTLMGAICFILPANLPNDEKVAMSRFMAILTLNKRLVPMHRSSILRRIIGKRMGERAWLLARGVSLEEIQLSALLLSAGSNSPDGSPPLETGSEAKETTEAGVKLAS